MASRFRQDENFEEGYSLESGLTLQTESRKGFWLSLSAIGDSQAALKDGAAYPLIPPGAPPWLLNLVNFVERQLRQRLILPLSWARAHPDGCTSAAFAVAVTSGRAKPKLCSLRSHSGGEVPALPRIIKDPNK
jgi:hypothetical protein